MPGRRIESGDLPATAGQLHRVDATATTQVRHPPEGRLTPGLHLVEHRGDLLGDGRLGEPLLPRRETDRVEDVIERAHGVPLDVSGSQARAAATLSRIGRIGRTSMLPTRAGGISEAMRMASLRSRASIM